MIDKNLNFTALPVDADNQPIKLAGYDVFVQCVIKSSTRSGDRLRAPTVVVFSCDLQTTN
ncbi:hypothetical protein SPFM6_00021 [Salmonella phage SPFM6]|nr:hypothetical protein SPFM6_00021 [Salmonella phage SPFM6]